MAWLLLAGGANWVPGPEDLFVDAGYDLTLTQADPGATEYVPGKTYQEQYLHASFGGDLGSFAFSETSQASPDAPLIVGPVAMTAPELPVSMVIQVQNRQLTEFKAVTGSGHQYTFAASPSPR